MARQRKGDPDKRVEDWIRPVAAPKDEKEACLDQEAARSEAVRFADSPEPRSQNTSDVEYGSYDEGHHSGGITPDENQKGYEKPTRAFTAKVREKGVSRQGSTKSLKEPPGQVNFRSSSRGDNTSYLVRTPPDFFTPPGAGSLHSTPGDTPPRATRAERYPSTIHETPLEEEVIVPAGSTMLLPTQLSQELRQLSPATSIIEAFERNESSRGVKPVKPAKSENPEKPDQVELLKRELKRSQSEIHAAKRDIKRLGKQRSTVDANGSPEEQLAAVQAIQQEWEKQEQTLREKISSLEQDVQRVNIARTELNAKLTIAQKDIETLQRENKEIESSMTTTQARLKEMEQSPNAELEAFKADMRRLREDIDAMQKAIKSNSKNISSYRRFLDTSMNKPNELILLRGDLRTILDQYASMLTEMEAKNEALLNDLAKKEQEIKTLQGSLASAVKQMSAEANNEHGQSMDTWEKLYENKSKQYDKVQEKFQALKKKNKANHRPDLELENKKLKTQLIDTRDENARLQSQHVKLREDAKVWESEFKNQRARYNKLSEETRKAIANLNEEMYQAVTEYRDKLPENDPNYWNIEKLQLQVKDLEEHLKDEVDTSNKLKKELGIAYREYMKLRDQNEAFKKELGVDDSYQPSSRPQKFSRKPRYESEEETLKRENLLKAFREKQAIAREKRENEQELIDAARKYKMGKHYPPSNSERYEAVVKKTPRERWEVDTYLRMKNRGAVLE